MNVTLLTKNLVPVGIFDVFESLIWKDKYCGEGDAEIVAAPTTNNVANLANTYFMTIPDSDRTMVLEGLEITSDVTNGNKLHAKAKSLESILKRRDVWDGTTISGNIQTAIHRIITENAISPSDSSRLLSRIVFADSTDPNVYNLTMAPYSCKGKNLYEVILEICQLNNLGFKLTVVSGNFVFKLYAGTDRSVAIGQTPPVVFSPANNNLASSTYNISTESLKTVILVEGTGDDGSIIRVTVNMPGGAGTDLDRRETYLDAGSSTNETLAYTPVYTEEQYSASIAAKVAEYLALLEQKGASELASKTVEEKFEGQVTAGGTFVYNTHYFIGDIVQVADAYGHASDSRVIEYVNSQDSNGVKHYPTFAAIP
jgi:hypothetical protein